MIRTRHARLGARAHQPADREGEGDPGQRRRARPAVLDAPGARRRTCRARPPTRRSCRRSSTAFKNHPALCAYKGIDEPRNPFRGAKWIRPAGLVRAHTRIKALDPKHPLVIIQAPRGPVSQLVPYRPAFDITGVDIFPIAYPPGLHCDNGNPDISVVGDMAVQDGGGERRQAVLDDAADRLERRRAVQGGARPRAPLPVAQAGALHGLPGDRERRARADLLRRAPDRGLHARRRQGRLELDVLAAGAAPGRARAHLEPAAARAARSRTRRSRCASSRTPRATSSWRPARRQVPLRDRGQARRQPDAASSSSACPSARTARR